MNQKPMDASVSIFEWVVEDESERCSRSGANRIDRGLLQPFNHLHPTLHQGRDIARLGAYIVHVFGVIAFCASNIVLSRSPSGFGISLIHDRVLQADEFRDVRWIERFGIRQCGNKPRRPIATRCFTLDRIGGFRFPRIKIMDGTGQDCRIAKR